MNKRMLESALASLSSSSLRRTKPREILLKFLVEEHGPFTIEEIRRAVKRSRMDLVTVYRCISAFEKIGLVRKCDFGDRIARYEFQSDKSHHHHHVICKRCHKPETLEYCALPKLEQMIEKMGYSQVTHSLEFFGMCAACQ